MDVSFIVPIFNNSTEDLIRIIKSVDLLTTKISCEFILIDDGSKEKLSLKYKKISMKYGVKYFRKKNAGVSSARNYGLEKATGNYIIFLDADDQFIASNFSEFDYLNFDLTIYNIEFENILKKQSKILALNENSNMTSSVFFNSLLKDGVLNFVTGKVYSKRFLDKYKIKFNENITVGEDLDFVSRILLLEPRVKYIPKEIYRYLFKVDTGEERIRKHPLQNLNDAIFVYKLRKNILSKVDTSNEINLDDALVDDVFEIYSRYLCNNKKEAIQNNYLFIQAVEYCKKKVTKKAKIKLNLILNKKYVVIIIYFKLRKLYKIIKK